MAPKSYQMHADLQTRTSQQSKFSAMRVHSDEEATQTSDSSGDRLWNDK